MFNKKPNTLWHYNFIKTVGKTKQCAHLNNSRNCFLKDATKAEGKSDVVIKELLCNMIKPLASEIKEKQASECIKLCGNFCDE